MGKLKKIKGRITSKGKFKGEDIEIGIAPIAHECILKIGGKQATNIQKIVITMEVGKLTKFSIDWIELSLLKSFTKKIKGVKKHGNRKQ